MTNKEFYFWIVISYIGALYAIIMSIVVNDTTALVISIIFSLLLVLITIKNIKE